MFENSGFRNQEDRPTCEIGNDQQQNGSLSVAVSKQKACKQQQQKTEERERRQTCGGEAFFSMTG